MSNTTLDSQEARTPTASKGHGLAQAHGSACDDPWHDNVTGLQEHKCPTCTIAIGRKSPTPPMGASNKGTRKHGGRANHGRPIFHKCKVCGVTAYYTCACDRPNDRDKRHGH